MSLDKKIYSDDPLVHYQKTTLSPERSKSEIDGVLAEFQIKDVHWHWDPLHNLIYVQFKLNEVVNGLQVDVAARVDCPTIWDKAKPKGRPPTPEGINWRVSMRAVWWFIKTHLEMSMVMKSSKVAAFLPNIVAGKDKTLKDIIIPRINQFQALPEYQDKRQDEEPPILEAEVVADEEVKDR